MILVGCAGDSDVSWKVLVAEIISLVEQCGKVQKFHIDLLRDCLQGSIAEFNLYAITAQN